MIFFCRLDAFWRYLGQYICKIADTFIVRNFGSVCFTNISLRSKSNKTDAKLLTSELTVSQIYRPLDSTDTSGWPLLIRLLGLMKVRALLLSSQWILVRNKLSVRAFDHTKAKTDFISTSLINITILVIAKVQVKLTKKVYWLFLA